LKVYLDQNAIRLLGEESKRRKSSIEDTAYKIIKNHLVKGLSLLEPRKWKNQEIQPQQIEVELPDDAKKALAEESKGLYIDMGTLASEIIIDYLSKIAPHDKNVQNIPDRVLLVRRVLPVRAEPCRSQYRRKIMAEKEMRTLALRDKDGNEIGVFTGKLPRQAALKAANRGHTDIKLLELSTEKLHVFTGERVQVDKPKGAPVWMPDKIWKPIVKKIGIEKIE
jgi:hypothetical protein